MRNRRVGASNRSSDPLGAGLYVFSGVQWLSPDDPREAQLLSDGLSRLVGAYPQLGGVDQLERHNRCAWDQRPGTQTKRRRQQHALPTSDGEPPARGAPEESSASSPSEHSGADPTSFALAPLPAHYRQPTCMLLD